MSTDLTGRTFGRLTVIRKSERQHKNRCYLWECLCECGNTVYVLAGNLKNGGTRSCGCLRHELWTKHNHAGDHLYLIWASMIQRCENPKNHAYARYGGKGVKVCPEWHDAKVFCEWAVANGYVDTPQERRRDRCSIDRINSNGDYCPDNCQIVTVSTNSKRCLKERWEGKTCDFVRLRNGRFAGCHN